MRVAPFEGVGGFLVGFLLANLVLLPAAASAHNATTWFDPVAWDDHTDVDYRIDDSIPGSGGSNFEDRIHDAAGHWNAVTGVGNFAFVDSGNGNRSWANPCNWKDATNIDVWVFYHDISQVGLATMCIVYHQQQDFSDIHSGRLAFASDGISWYKGTGSPSAGEYAVEDNRGS